MKSMRLEELNTYEIESNLVNIVILKPTEFGESSRKKDPFYVTHIRSSRAYNHLSFGCTPRKATSLEKLAFPQLAKWVTC